MFKKILRSFLVVALVLAPVASFAAPATETVVASALRTPATYNSSTFSDPGSHTGLRISVDASVVVATGTLICALQSKDPVSGNFVAVPGATTASITVAGTTDFVIQPNVTAVANRAVDISFPPTWRVQCIVGTANVTFSVGATYQPK